MSMSLRTALRRATSEAVSTGSRLPRAAVLAPRFAAPRAAIAAAPRFAAARSFATSSSALEHLHARNAWANNPIVEYGEVKPLTQRPTDDILIIDVRDPEEVALGTIPSAVNLPLSRIDEALDANFNPGAFQNEFAFAKPLPEQKIIFFCRSGKRSATAAEFGDIKGYPNIRNYVGSMLDWAEHEGLDPVALGL